MRFHKLRDGILNTIGMKIRLRIVCLWYLISLMTETPTFASELSAYSHSVKKISFMGMTVKFFLFFPAGHTNSETC